MRGFLGWGSRDVRSAEADPRSRLLGGSDPGEEAGAGAVGQRFAYRGTVCVNSRRQRQITLLTLRVLFGKRSWTREDVKAPVLLVWKQPPW